MFSCHGLRPQTLPFNAPASSPQIPRLGLSDGLTGRGHSLWLGALVFTLQRRVTARASARSARSTRCTRQAVSSEGDEPPSAKKVRRPTDEPLSQEEPLHPAASEEPVTGKKPVIEPVVDDPVDGPRKVPVEPSSEAGDGEGAEAAASASSEGGDLNDQVMGETPDEPQKPPEEASSTPMDSIDGESEDDLQVEEWEDEEDEEDEGVDRMMGLEAFQMVPREPTPPPASCSEGQDRDVLPICEMKDEILKQVAENRVVTIIGGTGCGKSTQVPQFIIREAAAKQLPCNIMVTQPRRLAATSLARRVAEELGLSMGLEVGYRIRGETVPGEHLSFVTAGYLLSWLTANPDSAKSMTHLILDEAHIRSADMELLLLMMRLVMRINSHLRVILMSATMEADFFGNYFAEFSDQPPVPLSVGGRLFPVNVMHLDDLVDGRVPGGKLPIRLRRRVAKAAKNAFKPEILNSIGEADLESQVVPKVAPPIREVVQEMIPVVAEGGSTILVFIPGYADLVRMHSWLYWNLPTAGSVNMGYVPPKPEQLTEDDEEEEQEDFDEFQEFQGMEGPLAEPPHAKRPDGDALENTSGGIKFRLFALHSQVAQEDQELVLQKPPSNICNVVLATTIAESSLTLPEVIGVIDFCVHKTSIGDPSQMGLCKISAQWCARSACLQREGRAGRTQPGWCIRMVPEKFFRALREYDVPEILRTPLTTLYLKAKGIADGLSEVVANDEELQQQLSLEAANPGELLQQLLAPPMTEAIDAAVYQLARLAVLTEESPNSKVTVLGRLALFLPLDIQLCRLVWLGCHFGCPAEAVVMAAACSTASPFANPSRLGFQDPDEFTQHLADTAAAWRFFDAGHFSEPIALFRLFLGWLRRLKLTPVRSSTTQRWFRATNMLEKDAAIDPSRMTAFVSFVADLAIRCRDLCCSERDEALSCRVRRDLHGLVLLLRRPDKSREEQRKLTDDDYVPDIGAIFRASASKLYALLAAAFSENLLTGSHIKSKDVDAMLDALEMLEPSGLASQDAVLIPQHGIKRSDEELAKLLETITGEEPKQVEQSSRFIAVRFKEEADSTPHWLRGKSALVSRRHDPRTMGLGPAVEPRLNAVNMAPRLCHMSAGGPRRFSIGDAEFARAVSPYELEFSVVHEARGNRRYMPGLFSEQTPLGFPCHVVSPDQPLGSSSSSFASVASEMILSEFGAARVNNTTLLMAEELVFALITMCPVGISLELGFGQGPGGSEAAAHAALMGLRFHRRSEPVLFRRCLPGMATLEMVNRIRTAIMENLVSPAETNPDGQEILLWEDVEAQKDFEDLIAMVENAKTIEEMGGMYGAQSMPVMWIRHRPNLRKQGETEEKEEDLEDFLFRDDELDEDADVQALQPIAVKDTVEHTVAYKAAELSPQIQHAHECPDCGERFDDWPSCLEHLVSTGHLDVSTRKLEMQAKKLTQPVRWRCLECFEGFQTMKDLEQHLQESGHLSWAAPKRKVAGKAGTQMLLCKPRPIPGLDTSKLEPSEPSEPSGFFRSLGASLWTRSPPTGSGSGGLLHPNEATEQMIADCDLPLGAKDTLRKCAGWDVRYVLNSYNAVKKEHVKRPTAWINGILKRMADQSLVTPPEWDSLLLSLDDLDLDFKARIPLKQIPLEDAKLLVKTLREDLATIQARPNGVETYLRLEIQKVKAAAKGQKQTPSPSPKKEPAAQAKVPEATEPKQLAESKIKKPPPLLPPPIPAPPPLPLQIPAPPEPEAAEALAANGPEGATKVPKKKRKKKRKQNKKKHPNLNRKARW